MHLHHERHDTLGEPTASRACLTFSPPARQQSAKSECSCRTFSPPLDSVASVNFPEPLQMGKGNLGYSHQQGVECRPAGGGTRPRVPHAVAGLQGTLAGAGCSRSTAWEFA